MAVPDGLASYAWVAACAVAAPAWLGFGLVRWLGLAPVQGLRLALGFGYVVGHYVLAHATLLWLWLGKPGPGWLLPLGAVLVGSWAWRRAGQRSPAAAPRQPARWWSWTPCLVLMVWFGEAITAANSEPLHLGDETAIWAAKAKVLYDAPGLGLQLGLQFFVEHPDYPLGNPLAQVLTYASAGRVLQFESRLPIQFFAVALLVLLSGALARRAHPLVAALVLVALASSSFANHALPAFADVPLACCTLAAVEALLQWYERGDRACFAIACLSAGAMLQMKNEGSLLVLAIALPFAAAVLLRRGRGGVDARGIGAREAAWLLVPVAACALQRGFNAWYSLCNDLADPALGRGLGLFERIVDQAGTHGGPVLRFYGGMLVNPDLHRLLPLSFLVAAPLAVAAHRGRHESVVVAMLAGAFVLAIGGYMAVFVGTVSPDVNWHLGTAADRTTLHVLPLAALGLAVAVAPANAAPR